MVYVSCAVKKHQRRALGGEGSLGKGGIYEALIFSEDNEISILPIMVHAIIEYDL